MSDFLSFFDYNDERRNFCGDPRLWKRNTSTEAFEKVWRQDAVF